MPIQKLRTVLWRENTYPPRSPQFLLLQLGRFIDGLVRAVMQSRISLHAMSLVYTSILSVVPLLAFSFSVLKAFGVYKQLTPMLTNLLEPLGEAGLELTEAILGFVSNIRVGVLGTVGLLFLLYSVIAMIQKVESGLNAIWQVQNNRSMSRRFTDYISVLMVGPLVFVTAITMTASLTNSDAVKQLADATGTGPALYLLGRIIPYLMVAAVFTFIYKFLPNTKVKLRAAIIGGLVAGTLWQTLGLGFTYFVRYATSYTAIYSGFAIVLLLMIWMYLAWLVVLIGSQIACFVQYPERLRPTSDELPSAQEHKLAVLNVLSAIVHRFRYGKPALAHDELTEITGASDQLSSQWMAPFLEAGIVAESETGWLLARDPEHVPMFEVWRLLESNTQQPTKLIDRAADDSSSGTVIHPRGAAGSDIVLGFQEAISEHLEGRNLAELANWPEPKPEDIPEPEDDPTPKTEPQLTSSEEQGSRG